jgi:hypothetical protein
LESLCSRIGQNREGAAIVVYLPNLHAIKDLKESMKKVREYCKLVQIFPCSAIASITM